MSAGYLDTSAAMKLIVDEPQSDALMRELTSREHGDLVASWLLHTELHCAAGRHPEAVDLAQMIASPTWRNLAAGEVEPQTRFVAEIGRRLGR